MPTSIKGIHIYAFRGIRDLELELDGKNMLLKGENGTGKSSIVEAFEFFFTGKLSIFEGEGTQSLSLQKHAPNKDFDKDDVSIKVTFNPGNSTLERTFANKPVPLPDLQKYFEAAQKGTFILRRSQILKFIASVPADRFRAIASIIGIERLDNIELEMKRAWEELDSSVNSKRRIIQNTLIEISRLLGENITEIKQVPVSLNKKLKEANLITITSFDEIDNIAQEMLKTFKETTDLEYVTSLNGILQELRILQVDEEIARSLRDLNKKLIPLLEEKKKRELSISEFLVKGKQAVEENERNICPLCGQEINRQELLKEINERLRTLSQLSEEVSEIRRISVDAEGKLNSLASTIEKISSELEPLKELGNARTKLLGTLKFLNKFVNKVTSAKELHEAIPVEKLERNSARLRALVKSLSIKCEAMLEKIGVPEDWKNKVKAISLANQVKALISESIRIEKQLKTEEQQYTLAKEVYRSFSEIKKNRIKEIYKSIAGNVNAFYSTLHPNDPHKNVELNVALGRRASTELQIESFSCAKEDPRAFTSEAHQDSLGLCIFLAFVKKFNEECNFVVLDDVVTTIDAQHRERICRLLFEQFRDYQLFVTTHDEIWYDQLSAHQRAFRVDGNWKNLEIIRWTFETGPIIEPYKTRWDKIKNKIDARDKQGAANDGRQYLEWLLKKVCEVIMAKPVFKTDRYTVSDLLAPAKERLNQLVADVQFTEKANKGFQELEATIIMGNLLSHDNPEAENTSIEEVKRFCEAVQKLHNIFACPACISFLKYYQDMKKIRCPDPHCKKPIEIACK
jgi:AAA15 family ATPase/GTPase